MKILDIIKSAGHDTEDFNNRQKAVIQINKLLKSGVSIAINEPGMVWKSKKTGNKCNIKVSGFGWTTRYYAGTLVEPMDVLMACANLLKIKEVKETISAKVQTPCECGKCKGEGVIKAFYYYAQGVCFDCGGTGIQGGLSIILNK